MKDEYYPRKIRIQLAWSLAIGFFYEPKTKTAYAYLPGILIIINRKQKK